MNHLRYSQRSNLLPILLFALLAVLSSACSEQPAGSGTSAALPALSVDATFKEFYNRAGGFDVLGPPISGINDVDHFRVQFTTAALMVHDPLAGPEGRFFLAPLGLELEVAEPPIAPPAEASERFREGHLVHEDFWRVYSQLAELSGPPLTEGRYNPAKQRFEQYFANLGFYIADGDPDRLVRTMDYGAFKCDRYCRYRSHPSAAPALLGVIAEPFATAVSRLGSSFTGRALTDAYASGDGATEVIFDNLVLYSKPASPGRVEARPIVESLEIQPHPLVPRIDDTRMDFYPLDGDLGHNIPVIFTDFLAQHGSLDISGPPITEIYLYDQQENIFRQCFTNLCLDYHHAATEEETLIRPAPLGLVYKTKFYNQAATDTVLAEENEPNLTIRVWEDQPLLAPGGSQTIRAGIFRGNTPIAGVVADVTVEYPDGTEKVFFFPPTDEDGISSLELSPLHAANGTVMPYVVCLQNVDGRRLCTADE
ncbi:MAG: hypothetical protein R3335_12400, partial [Anaerolineales bacterium]|nr:hypothetical protein [Anaerolineales bacterium]